ncbi:MAG: polyamine aminopropyltransferase [Nitrospirae bacterium]|nr:polyamine aminopropyltransferase [Nitrospirota bacterium]
MEPKSFKWFHDYLSPDEGHIHGIKDILYTKQTKYQQMEIMSTTSYGRCLVLDGKMQSTEKDEFIYHEILVHPAMLAHPNPKNIFIVGGGEGATLREVLKHKSVEHVLMVDIDQEVVGACKKHLPEWHQGSFDDKKTELKFFDARKYLEDTDTIYDVIIIDISEPVEEGPAYLLYTKEFYNIVNKKLSPEGAISLQAGTTAVHSLLCLCSVYQTIKTAFPHVAVHEAYVPSFGLPWGFITASKKSDLKKITEAEINDSIKKRIKGTLRYYDGETHLSSFHLAKHIRKSMEEYDKIIEDNAPIFTYH